MAVVAVVAFETWIFRRRRHPRWRVDTRFLLLFLSMFYLPQVIDIDMPRHGGRRGAVHSFVVVRGGGSWRLVTWWW